MATQNTLQNPNQTGSIAEAIIPRIELFKFGNPTAMEPPGSIGDNTGPTTGQISPRP